MNTQSTRNHAWRGTPFARTAGLVFALGMASAVMPAFATETDHAPQLLVLLRLIDQSPTRAQLVEAGAGEDGAALVRIARDQSLTRYPRARAAGALGMFPGSERALTEIAEDTSFDDAEVRVQSIAALAFISGTRAIPRFARLLGDLNPEVRAAAVRALGRLPHPDARAALRENLPAEREPWVRALMTQKLGE